MNGCLEFIVGTFRRAESFQRSEPNHLLRRNFSVELVREQHIKRPLLDVERVDMFAVLTLEHTEDVDVGASLRISGTGVGAGVPALCGPDAESDI